MLAATHNSSFGDNDETLKSRDSLSELVKGTGQILHLKFIQPSLISSSAAHWILAAGGMLREQLPMASASSRNHLTRNSVETNANLNAKLGQSLL